MNFTRSATGSRVEIHFFYKEFRLTERAPWLPARHAPLGAAHCPVWRSGQRPITARGARSLRRRGGASAERRLVECREQFQRSAFLMGRLLALVDHVAQRRPWGGRAFPRRRLLETCILCTGPARPFPPDARGPNDLHRLLWARSPGISGGVERCFGPPRPPPTAATKQQIQRGGRPCANSQREASTPVEHASGFPIPV